MKSCASFYATTSAWSSKASASWASSPSSGANGRRPPARTSCRWSGPAKRRTGNDITTRGRVMKGDDISDRLIDLAVRVIRLAEALPATKVGGHVGRQLFRAATSAGANFEEARGAESRADSVHKVGVGWKECRESVFWLK